MHLCIFNPEHDLCLAKGRANYMPPRSAVEFAKRDSSLMQLLYPGAVCCSAYDVRQVIAQFGLPQRITAWGWNITLKHQLRRQGVPEHLLPSDTEIENIRELQHRTTVVPIQFCTRIIHSVEEMEALLQRTGNWVMKAPWSGAGRGLRWVHDHLTEIDKRWIMKTVAEQRCVMVEDNIYVMFNVGLEYWLEPREVRFMGYSVFTTRHGVYERAVGMSDEDVELLFPHEILRTKDFVERWLEMDISPRYRGPLGVDLMVDEGGEAYVSEVNFRHTMGMVDHARRYGV